MLVLVLWCLCLQLGAVWFTSLRDIVSRSFNYPIFLYYFLRCFVEDDVLYKHSTGTSSLSTWKLLCLGGEVSYGFQLEMFGRLLPRLIKKLMHTYPTIQACRHSWSANSTMLQCMWVFNFIITFLYSCCALTGNGEFLRHKRALFICSTSGRCWDGWSVCSDDAAAPDSGILWLD